MASAQSKSRSKKRQIIDVALACFTEHGVAGTTIEMIRAASGASVGSLYHHFGNKEAIAAAVFIEGMRDFGVLVARALESAQGAEAGIRALVMANIEWISANPDWARFCFQHRGVVRTGQADERFGSDQQLFQQCLRDWFAPHAAQLRALAPEVFAALLIGPTHEYARHWLAGRVSAPLHAQGQTFADAAWNSLKAEPAP